MLSNGKQKRPDKVLLWTNETIIIDYKLSNWDRISEKEKEKHKKQLNDYRNLLQMMGYPNVKTHLIYIEDTIQRVEVATL